MGVKGLFQFLKRFEDKVDITEYIANKSVGIDIFWFIHRSKGDLFSLQASLLPIIKSAATIYCVFDGVAPSEKREELKARAERREDILATCRRIEEWLSFPFHRINSETRQIIRSYMFDLQREAWTPSPMYIQTVWRWLETKGCILSRATGEADDTLAELESSGAVDIIITNDSDLLLLGARTVLRVQYGCKKGAVYERDAICKKIDFTAEQWNHFMYLCRHMKETDILLAFSFVSVYKDLDIVLQKYYTLYEDELLQIT